MHEKLTPFDPAQHLQSDEAIDVFMTGALETQDPGFIAYAMEIVARARSWDEPPAS